MSYDANIKTDGATVRVNAEEFDESVWAFIRTGRSLTSVSMTPTQARELALALTAAAELVERAGVAA